jgi:hypothetical protein
MVPYKIRIGTGKGNEALLSVLNVKNCSQTIALIGEGAASTARHVGRA